MILDAPQYLSEKDISRITGFSLSKLRQDRFFRRGLPYIKTGRSVRYDLKDVVGYMEARKIIHRDQENWKGEGS